MFHRTNLINKKNETEDDIQYLILLICEQVPSSIQQQACIFFGIPFAANIPVEALPVSLHIPCHIQLQMDFSFPKLIPAHSNCVFILLLSHLSLCYSLYPCLFYTNSATGFLLIPEGLLLLLCDHLHIKTDYS